MKPRDYAIVVLVCVAAVLTASATKAHWDAARASERLREAEELAEAALDSLAAVRGVRDSLAAADSARQAALRDSTAVWEAREALRRSQLDSERRHHASLADSVKARVDSATAVMVVRLEESVDSIVGSYEEIVAAKDAQIGGMGLLLESKDDLLDALAKEVVAWERRSLAQSAVEDALRDQVAAERTKKRVGYGVGALGIALAIIK